MNIQTCLGNREWQKVKEKKKQQKKEQKGENKSKKGRREK